MQIGLDSTRSAGFVAYLRSFGAAWLMLSGGLVWLAAGQFSELTHGEVISWSGFTIAVVGWVLIGRERPAPLWLIGVAGAAVVTLGTAFVLALTAANAETVKATTYVESRGAGLCSSERCDGHEAGWAWAAENGVADPDQCGGRSISFTEGCRAFGEEAQGGL